jgi:hypothetical protein
MRKWYVPATVVGLSGLGALLFTERGRAGLRWMLENLQRAPDRLLEWNDSAQHELERIQTSLNRVASTLESVRSAVKP